jgi:hypothetical protein
MGVDCFCVAKRAEWEWAMHIDSSKLLAIEIFAAFSVLPLIIWLALYLASRRWPIDARPILRWLKILRWVGWGFGMALCTLTLAREHFPIIYGLAMTTFSTGLSIPQGWLKRRFAPDLIEPSSDWWPSKSQ